MLALTFVGRGDAQPLFASNIFELGKNVSISITQTQKESDNFEIIINLCFPSIVTVAIVKDVQTHKNKQKNLIWIKSVKMKEKEKKRKGRRRMENLPNVMLGSSKSMGISTIITLMPRNPFEKKK